MSIKVRYFASLAEQLGCSETELKFVPGMTVMAVWQLLHPGRVMPSNVLAAVNMDYATLDSVVNDHDEVAFFPPITGGQK